MQTEQVTETKTVRTEQEQRTEDETGPRPEHTHGPRDRAAYSAGTGPRGDWLDGK